MENCPICLEDTIEKWPCGHYAHKDCLIQAVNARQQIFLEESLLTVPIGQCPLCRTEIPTIVPEDIPWLGHVDFYRTQIHDLLEGVGENDGFSDDLIDHVEYVMDGATRLQQYRFLHVAQTAIWQSPTSTNKLHKMRILQPRPGYFQTKFFGFRNFHVKTFSQNVT